MGDIVFYEGSGGSQDIVQTVSDSPGQDFRPDHNDEIASVKLLDVRPGTVISVFDDRRGSKDDDFAVIQCKKSAPEYTVSTFERSYEDEYVLVSYGRRDGLDGKVSRIRIS
jgi:hypothetical protein